MTTFVPAASAPVLSSATPADNMSAVSGSANIVLQFSDVMHAGSGYITISDGASQTYMGRDGLLHTRLVGATDTRLVSITDTSQVTISGNTVTINLAADLKGGLNYSVQMPSGTLLGSNGASYAGLLDATKLNFSVSTAAAGPAAKVGSAIYMMDSGSAPDYVTNVASQRVWGSLNGTLAAGETVQVSLDSGSTWHAAATTSDGWSYEGTISASSSILARVTNSAGAYSEQASQAYVYDTAGPSIASMVLARDALQGSQTTTLTVTFSEIVSNLTLDAFGGHYRNMSNLQTADGGLTWTADVAPGNGIMNSGGDVMLNASALQDRAGNYGASDWVTASFYYDANPPVLSAGSIALSSDSGGSASDLITKVASQVISGSYTGEFHAVRGAKIEVSVNNGATWSQASADNATHTWRYEGTLAGSSTILVRLTDTVGEVSTVSQAYTLDTAAPQLSTLEMESATLLANQSTTVTLAFSEKILTLDSSMFNLDGATLSGFTTADNITWTATLSTGSAAGTGSISLKAGAVADLAGNTGPASASASLDFTVAAPSLPTASVTGTISISGDSGASGTDYVTNIVTQTLSGTYAGTLDAQDRIEVSIDGGETWMQADASAGTWELATYFSAEAVDQNGNGMLRARVANESGHSDALGRNYTFDINPPTVEITVHNSTLQLNETTTVTFGFSEAVTALDASMFSLTDGTLSGFTPADGGVVWTATLTPRADLSGTGSISFIGAVADLAGNEAVLPATIDFSYNAALNPPSPPSLASATLVLKAASDSGISNSDGITNVSQPELTVSLGANSGLQVGQEIVIYDATLQTEVARHALTSSDLVDNAGVLSLQTSLLADGAHELVVRAVTSGQYGTASSAAASLTIDTQAPLSRLTPAALSYSQSGPPNMQGAISGGTLSNEGANAEFVEYTNSYGRYENSWQRTHSTNGTDWIAISSNPGAGVPVGLRVADVAGNLSYSIGTPSSKEFFLGDGDGGSAIAYAGMVLFSGASNDWIEMRDSSINYIDGGAGTDTLTINESVQLSLDTLIGHMTSIEKISLAANATLSVDAVSNGALSALGLPSALGHAVLRIDGAASSGVSFVSGGWGTIDLADVAYTALSTALSEVVSLSGYTAHVNAADNMIILVGSNIGMPPA